MFALIFWVIVAASIIPFFTFLINSIESDKEIEDRKVHIAERTAYWTEVVRQKELAKQASINP